jgi:hypothetical protein
MSKIIGGPLNSKVVAQLNLRRDKHGIESGRTNEDLQYLNSKTGWVKFTSGVNIQGSSKWAKEYILIGGTINRFGDEAYSTFDGRTGKGFRPMPGITNVQIRSVGQFGTLKEATVTFNCWDVDQIQNLELLYMRPGFTALLEWGHSLYYTSPGNLVKVPSTVTKIFPQTTTTSEGKSVTSQAGKQGIYDEIEKLREESGYNYDGIFGFIKNFSWSFRPDGGYDCTTTIVSIGELIESLTVDTDVASNTTDNSPAASATNVKPATMIENVMKVFIDSPSALDISTKYPEFWEKYKEVNTGDDILQGLYQPGITVKNTSTETTAGDAGNFSWLSLKHLCRVINAAILIDDTEKNIIKLNTSNTRTSRFKTFSKHVSSDPRICLIATNSVDYWYGNLPGATTAIDIIRGQIDGDRDSILNIYVSVHFVAEVMTSLREQPKESRTLVNMIQPILQKINDALGGINNLDLHYEEEEFTYYIVDRQLETAAEENTLLPKLDITGLKSTVSQFNFTTKLSPSITTMLAISAQASAADVGLEAEALLAWNSGLRDRIITQRKQRQKEEDREVITAERQKAQDDRVTTIMQGFTSFWRDKQYIKDQIDAGRTAYSQYATTHIQFLETGAGEGKNPAGIIPFEVSIQMEGIGGLKKGQAFTINRGIMPEKYNDVVGFIVTGIDHDISNNRWVTNIKAQTIIIGKGKAKAPAPIEEIKKLPTKEKSKPLTKKSALEPEFIEAVAKLEDRLGVERDALYRIMKHESGLSASIENNIGCVGLIQFCPDVPRGQYKKIGKKNYLLADIKKMTRVEQLEVVEEYYKPIKGKAKTIGDLYMFTFLPAAVGKADSFVIGIENAKTTLWGLPQGKLYSQNKGFDADKKGYYTVGDVRKRINNFPR